GLHPRDHRELDRARQAVHRRARWGSEERTLPAGGRPDRHPRRGERGGGVVLPRQPGADPDGRLPALVRHLRLGGRGVDRDAALAGRPAAVRGGEVTLRHRHEHQLVAGGGGRHRHRHRLRLLRAVADRRGALRGGGLRCRHQAHVRDDGQDRALHGRLAHGEHHLLGVLPDEVPGRHGPAARATARLPSDGCPDVHPAHGGPVPAALRDQVRRGAATDPGGGRRGRERSGGDAGGRRLGGAVGRKERPVAMRNVLAIGLCLGFFGSAAATDNLAPGAMLDTSTAEQAKDLLPPEIYEHFKKGDYYNPVVEFPNSRFAWDDGFAEATEWNRQHLVLDEHRSPIDKTTGKRPDYIQGLPFPDIRQDDPDAGYKALWNLDYAYYTGGNSRNLTLLNWVSRSGIDRSSVQDVYFLYYEGQPKQYTPAKNPDNYLFQFLAL